MRETNAVCGLPGCLWASSSGDRLLVALPYKWDMSQAKVHASNHLFKPNALLQFFERTWHQSLFLDKGFHTCLGACTPVAFVTMPAGSSDSLCYDLRHNMSFDDRIQFHLDVLGFQTQWFPCSWLVLIWTRLALGESFPSSHLVTGDIALFPRGAALPVHKITSSQHNLKPDSSSSCTLSPRFQLWHTSTENVSFCAQSSCSSSSLACLVWCFSGFSLSLPGGKDWRSAGAKPRASQFAQCHACLSDLWTSGTWVPMKGSTETDLT